MSRSWKFLFAAALLAPAPVLAQSAATAGPSDGVIAEKMLGAGGRITPDRSRGACLRTQKQGEITVCAPNEGEQRIQSSRDEDPTSREALRDGRLHTPDVAGNGIFKGKPSFTFGSVEQPYIIDLASIPMAPAGSDADKIAKGEIRAP